MRDFEFYNSEAARPEDLYQHPDMLFITLGFPKEQREETLQRLALWRATIVHHLPKGQGKEELKEFLLSVEKALKDAT